MSKILSHHREFQRRSDEDSHAIIAGLREAVDACNAIGGPYTNVPLVIFPDAVKILAGYRALQLELEWGVARSDLLTVRQDSFPYIDYRAAGGELRAAEKIVANDLAVGDAKQAGWRDGARAWGLETAFRLASLPQRGKKVAVFASELGRALPFGLRRAGMAPLMPRPTKLGGIDFERQWAVFADAITAICARFHMAPDGGEQLRLLLRAHCQQFFIGGRNPRLDVDALVVGNLMHIWNRIIAVRARLEGVPVITVDHGQASGVCDEPVLGYGERTFATHHLGYGSRGMADRQGIVHAHSYIMADEPLGWIASDAEKVKAIYQPGRPIEPFGTLVGKRLVYVPTSFSGLRHAGPYRAMPDTLYLSWQKHLLTQFPDMILKAYPFHENKLWGYGDLNPARLETRRFEDVIDEAEVFILDFPSTALMLAAATTKPIIYFDMGLRNLPPQAWDALRERCIVVEVDRLDDPDLLDKIQAGANIPRHNTLFSGFSLENTGRTRVEDLILGIGDILAFTKSRHE